MKLPLATLISVFTSAETSIENFAAEAHARAAAPGPAPGVVGAPAGGPAPGPASDVEKATQTKEVFKHDAEEHFEEEIKDGAYDKPTPVLLGWEVEFEIENYNYFDLNKALVIPVGDEEVPAKKKKLVKPEAEAKKEPRFWSHNAVDMSFGKTGTQSKDFPEKIDDDDRKGLYPVDLTDGHNPAFATAGTEKVVAKEEQKVESDEKSDEKVVVAKKVEKAEESVEQAAEQEETKASTEVKQEVEAEQKSGSSSWDKTVDQFGELTETGGPQHDKDGKMYPADLAGSFIQTKLRAAMGRCLTEEGIFEDTCVVDVLRNAVKGAFVDLVETVLDTPAERDELMDWFLHRQSNKHDEKLGGEEAMMKNAHASASFMEVRKHVAKNVQSKLFARQYALAPAPAAAPVSAPAAGPGGAAAPGMPVLEKALQPKADGAEMSFDSTTSGKFPPTGAPGAPPGAPGAAPGPVEFKADVFVQFYPGEERPVVQDGEVGRSTIVKVWLRGAPNTGVFELAPWIEGVLKRHEEDGLLEMLLEKRLFDATEIAPKIRGIKDIRLDSKQQWSLNTCEFHMKKIMREFSMAYTRRMVPTAIYNECTNFVSEVSFSHDRIFDAHDRIKCRHATVKLSKEWNFGKGKPTTPAPEAEEASAPAPGPAAGPAAASPVAAVAAGPAAPLALASKPDIDLKGFCSDVCEIKYGSDAPTCHVTEGKKLWSAAP